MLYTLMLKSKSRWTEGTLPSDPSGDKRALPDGCKMMKTRLPTVKWGWSKLKSIQPHVKSKMANYFFLNLRLGWKSSPLHSGDISGRKLYCNSVMSLNECICTVTSSHKRQQRVTSVEHRYSQWAKKKLCAILDFIWLDLLTFMGKWPEPSEKVYFCHLTLPRHLLYLCWYVAHEYTFHPTGITFQYIIVNELI